MASKSARVRGVRSWESLWKCRPADLVSQMNLNLWWWRRTFMITRGLCLLIGRGKCLWGRWVGSVSWRSGSGSLKNAPSSYRSVTTSHYWCPLPPPRCFFILPMTRSALKAWTAVKPSNTHFHHEETVCQTPESSLFSSPHDPSYESLKTFPEAPNHILHGHTTLGKLFPFPRRRVLVGMGVMQSLSPYYEDLMRWCTWSAQLVQRTLQL